MQQTLLTETTTTATALGTTSSSRTKSNDHHTMSRDTIIPQYSVVQYCAERTFIPNVGFRQIRHILSLHTTIVSDRIEC